MASKLSLFRVLFALAMLAVQLEAGGALPSIHFANAVVNRHETIAFTIKFGGVSRGPLRLNPGQEYQISVKVNEVYFVSAVLGSAKVAAFHAYEPDRDGSHADVYWRADEDGFSISYDMRNWKLVAAWESG